MPPRKIGLQVSLLRIFLISYWGGRAQPTVVVATLSKSLGEGSMLCSSMTSVSVPDSRFLT